MATGRPLTRPPAPSVLDTVHYDIGILSTRVTQNDAAIAQLSTQLGQAVKDLGGSINIIADKIEKQRTDYADSRGTNWYGFIGAATAILVVIGSFLAVAKNPIDVDLLRHETQIEKLAEIINQLADKTATKEQVNAYKLSSDNWSASLRDRIADLEKSLTTGYVTKGQLTDLKSALDAQEAADANVLKAFMERSDKRQDAFDAQLIKRPEIEALIAGLQERLNAIASGLHEVQHDTSSGYTRDDRLKSLEAELNEARKQTSAAAAQGK